MYCFYWEMLDRLPVMSVYWRVVSNMFVIFQPELEKMMKVEERMSWNHQL